MTAVAPETRMVPLLEIQTDESSQPRVHTRPGVVREYAAAMKAQREDGGLRFPPIVLFTDGLPSKPEAQAKESFACASGFDGKLEACPTTVYYLGDGYHRVLAARKAGLTEFPAQIHEGTQRDAVLYGISANSTHGLPRTNADKRRAVALLLDDAEWSQWSDREIARRCQVSHRTVAFVRRRASGQLVQMRERKVRRGAKTYAVSVKPSSQAPADALAGHIPGTPIPDARVHIFASLGIYQEAQAAIDHLAKLLDTIAKGPSGELYAKQLIWRTTPEPGGFICSDLRACAAKLAAARPYCAYCPRCFPGYPDDPYRGCTICAGRGWTTRANFEVCTFKERENLLKLMEIQIGTPAPREQE